MKVAFSNPERWYQNNHEIIGCIKNVLHSGKYVLGENVDKFEDELAKFLGKKYAITVGNGTDALFLALKVLDIRRKDRVLISGHTFIAGIQAILQCGATPVLLDKGDKQNCKNIKAAIPVYMASEFENWDIDVPVIEDCCQAFGVKEVGYGLMQCYSFYPTKILGCAGDGGAITTDDKKIADQVRSIRNHGRPTYLQWGCNSRLDEIQAVILRKKLKCIDENITRRKQVAKRYSEQLKECIGLPKERETWQEYIIHVRDRNKLYDFCIKNGVEVIKNEYPSLLPIPKKAKVHQKETLRLPCNDTITDSEIDYVIETINKFYS